MRCADEDQGKAYMEYAFNKKHREKKSKDRQAAVAATVAAAAAAASAAATATPRRLSFCNVKCENLHLMRGTTDASHYGEDDCVRICTTYDQIIMMNDE